jgi:hypothetical protein
MIASSEAGKVPRNRASKNKTLTSNAMKTCSVTLRVRRGTMVFRSSRAVKLAE